MECCKLPISRLIHGLYKTGARLVPRDEGPAAPWQCGIYAAGYRWTRPGEESRGSRADSAALSDGAPFNGGG
jgi:hypothetical protein